jgi:hypothetical protein
MINKNVIATVALVLISWGAFAQHHDGEHVGHSDDQKATPVFQNEALGVAYTHYIQLKNALIESNFQQSKTASEALTNALLQVKNSANAHAEATKVVQASSLETQRKLLNALSNEIATLIKGSKLTSGELYLEFCPMANGNTGGYWLSSEKEIRNPYFGTVMLKCGSVKEVIN